MDDDSVSVTQQYIIITISRAEQILRDPGRTTGEYVDAAIDFIEHSMNDPDHQWSGSLGEFEGYQLDIFGYVVKSPRKKLRDDAYRMILERDIHYMMGQMCIYAGGRGLFPSQKFGWLRRSINQKINGWDTFGNWLLESQPKTVPYVESPRLEAPCKQCARKNDLGVSKCWNCERENPHK